MDHPLPVSRRSPSDATEAAGSAARWPAVAVALICVFVLGAAAYFGWLLLALPPGTGSDTKVLAAVLGLLGVVATGAISLAGLVLKHSVDLHALRLQADSAVLARQAERRLVLEAKHNRLVANQAERRLRLDADHNRQLTTQAEDRLRLETAIQAVGMLSTSAGSPAPDGQKAGALFALASLNQIDFALALLENLWAKDEIDAVSAVWLVNRGLLAGAPHEGVAVNILRNNIRKLHVGQGNYLWPDCVSNWWKPELGEYVREILLINLLQLAVMVPREEWDDGYLVGMLEILYACASTDPSRRIRRGAALGMQVLRQALELNEGVVIYGLRKPLPFFELVRVENELLARGDDSHDDPMAEYLLKLVSDLEVWAGLAEPAAALRTALVAEPPGAPSA